MTDKLNISLVSYWNTLPFLHGLRQNGLDKQFNIETNIPSKCAEKLINGQSDIGLVPVAAIPSIQNAQIISDYCIGSVGPVGTVCLYAKQPLDQLDTILLDYESRTSVRLTEILLRDYWDWKGQLSPATVGYESQINGRTGALIIGDRAIEALPHFEFVYDLGEAWTNWTKRPFVFAAWVANKPVSLEIKTALNAAFDVGMKAVPMLSNNPDYPYPHFSLERYYTDFISYRLDAAKQGALDLFLSKLGYALPSYA
ncbi:MAG: menaquinone biosynthesis protein [Bacteroidota bacterium]